jgi:two-component system LytT family response regulator
MPDVRDGRLTVLVVDDEAPARQRLVELLDREPDAIVVHEATDGHDAVEAIGRWSPDLVFLDVQMPECDGLAVVAAVGADAMPLTVFVTAFDQHAVRAFEANALDYLLKPFSDERFEATMARARRRLEERASRVFGERLERLLAQDFAYLDRLVVKVGGSSRFLDVGDIEWIEAAGVYVTLHVGNREVLHRMALGDLETRLDPRRFVRIHRSAVVNLACVQRLEPLTHGEFDVLMRSGGRVRLSRTYRAHLESRLKQSL